MASCPSRALSTSNFSRRSTRSTRVRMASSSSTTSTGLSDNENLRGSLEQGGCQRGGGRAQGAGGGGGLRRGGGGGGAADVAPAGARPAPNPPSAPRPLRPAPYPNHDPPFTSIVTPFR